MDEALATNETGAATVEPIIINLGKKKRKQIKRLKKGKGKLWREVMDVVDEVGEQIEVEGEGPTLVPIILLYRRKDKKWRRARLPRF